MMIKARYILVVGVIGFFWLSFEAGAQTLAVGTDQDGVFSKQILEIFIFIALLGLLPSLLLICTSFPFYLVIFSFLRQGMGLQQSPPNMLLIALAIFVTFLHMEPILIDVWQNLQNYLEEKRAMTPETLLGIFEPLKIYMQSRIDPATLVKLPGAFTEVETLPIKYLVPSFLTNELGRAFQIAFAIILPFLIIDLAVAAILMAVGMMMVPPSIISLPVKIGFFVAIDGWTTLIFGLV